MDPFNEPSSGESSDLNPFTSDLWPEPVEVNPEEDESEMCDHDVHKEVVPMQEMRGVNAMGMGGQFGTSEAIIVCAKCEKACPVDRVDQSDNDSLLR